ncbi:MAG: phosphatase PAP2 family protein [Firmicutes bacterium]|nr:phosphatase PAP2 family protein [Bacillota bacterium]
MKKRSLFVSVSDAIQGIIHVVRWERNMRIHLCLGLLVVILATVLGVTRLEMTALILTIGIMFVAELVNTAIEEIVDLVTPDFYPLAGVIKNISAGAVLVAASTAVAVGYLVFIDYILQLDEVVFRQHIPLHYLIILILVTITMVIIGWKASLGQDEFLRGGMPSGHTALAVGLAVAIWETSHGFPVVAGFAIAALVAQSRVDGNIHNWWEVLTGALVGAVLTLVFFRLSG